MLIKTSQIVRYSENDWHKLSVFPQLILVSPLRLSLCRGCAALSVCSVLFWWLSTTIFGFKNVDRRYLLNRINHTGSKQILTIFDQILIMTKVTNWAISNNMVLTVFNNFKFNCICIHSYMHACTNLFVYVCCVYLSVYVFVSVWIHLYI